ncbi:MAG: tRNA uridine-5-carboxymethylaminomethyl(34) synthesis enzyme MnmG, partial [Deltaproteobacteria bacterium]|nr:tRNA uridine-5-carboxymethylaminomethyl(34) synthesis enzyme MnmG [Deltaproteobacteria bacterium]
GRLPVVLRRDQAYIGVMIDDLVTKGTQEPYRMFTSRAEYRLLLREDNADLRLRGLGHEIGLVSDALYEKFRQKRNSVDLLLNLLCEGRLNPDPETNRRLEELGIGAINQPAALMDVLKRPGVTLESLAEFDRRLVEFPQEVAGQAMTMVKYDGYIKRQMEQVERFKQMEGLTIPEDFDYQTIPGLSNEVKEKLSRIRPVSLGQASRISGMTPAAVSVIQVYLKKRAAV